MSSNKIEKSSDFLKKDKPRGVWHVRLFGKICRGCSTNTLILRNKELHLSVLKNPATGFTSTSFLLFDWFLSNCHILCP